MPCWEPAEVGSARGGGRGGYRCRRALPGSGRTHLGRCGAAKTLDTFVLFPALLLPFYEQIPLPFFALLFLSVE